MKVIKIILVLILMIFTACGNQKSVKTSQFFPKDNEVYFGFDSYKVKEKFIPTIQENTQYLKENPKTIVILEGHADHIGSEEYNLDLGDKRARSIKAHLISEGVSPKQIIVVTFGEQLEKDKKDLKLNRRVIFRDIRE